MRLLHNTAAICVSGDPFINGYKGPRANSLTPHRANWATENRGAKSDSYVYDANGNLTQYTDRNGTVDVFTYDGLNRRTAADFGKNGSNYQDTIGYTFDGGNRLTQAVDALGGTIARTYDGLDRLTEEQTPQGDVTYGYDNASRRTAMTVAGQSAVGYTWDNANRLTQIAQGSSTVGFAWDNANRRTTLTLPNGVTVAYAMIVTRG